MEPITAHKYYDQLAACRELGLIGETETPKKEKVAGIVNQYNATLIPVEEPTELYTTVWKAPRIDESQAIENARTQLTAMMADKPIETPIETALDQAMQALSPDLAQALQAQFMAMEIAAQSKKPKSSSREKVDPSIRRSALIEKHRQIYEQVNDLRRSGEKKNHAEMTIALQWRTSQGAIGFYWVAYHVYSRYEAVRNAVDNGSYPVSALSKDATKANRSAIISEKLGVSIEIDISIEYN